MRQEHWLSKNHNSESASRMILVDCETWTAHPEQTLRLGSAVYMRWSRGKWIEQRFDFKRDVEFHEWLDKIVSFTKKGRIWLISHNMAFDFPLLEMMYYFQHGGWHQSGAIVPKNPCIYEFRKDSVTLRVISSTNWYKNTLEELGKRCGCPKKPSPDFRTSDWMVSDEEMMDYCRGDVDTLQKVVVDHINFVKEHDLGALQMTAPGQAFASYRHRFMPEKLLVHHRPGLLELELDSYRGGRSEMFQSGKVKDVHYLDFNSMYPSVMKGNLYPVRPISKKPLALFNGELPSSWDDDLLIARCELDLKKNVVGLKIDGKLTFATGHLVGTLCSPELDYLRDHPEAGSVHRYLKAMNYEGAPIFDEYVDFFYGMKAKAKKEGDLVTEGASKLWLNSLYGKMGQRLHPPIEIASKSGNEKGITDYMLESGMTEVRGDDYTFTKIGDEVYRRGRKGLNEVASNSMPRISSFCTSYARTKLQELIDLAGIENSYYCDTDSLLVNKKGYQRALKAGMVDNDALGKLKLDGVADGDFGTLKTYCWNGKWRRKGISHKAVEIAPNVFRQAEMETGLSAYKNGRAGSVMVKQRIKTISNVYDKGTIDAKTKRVIPLVMNQW